MSFDASIFNTKIKLFETESFFKQNFLNNYSFPKIIFWGTFSIRKTWIYKRIMDFSLKNSSSQFCPRVISNSKLSVEPRLWTNCTPTRPRTFSNIKVLWNFFSFQLPDLVKFSRDAVDESGQYFLLQITSANPSYPATFRYLSYPQIPQLPPDTPATQIIWGSWVAELAEQ